MENRCVNGAPECRKNLIKLPVSRDVLDKAKVHLEKDEKSGKVRSLEHYAEPYTTSKGLTAAAKTPRELSSEYLKEVAHILELGDDMLEGSETQMDENKLTFDQAPKNKLAFRSEKPAMGTTVVTYGQTYMGTPIVDGGISVYVNNDPMQITRSQNSVHYDVKVKKPNSNAKFMPDRFNKELVSDLLSLNQSIRNKGEPNIENTRLLVYQYNPDLRIDPKIKENEDFRRSVIESMTLPGVAPEIQPNEYYFVTEVIFSFTLLNWSEPRSWRAYFEAETGSLLHLFALTDFVDGMIYSMDPLRATGDENIIATSSSAILDPLRTLVTLQGLRSPSNPQGNQELKGDLVELVETSNPPIPPPSEPLAASFKYSVLTDNFAAVNAYYHSHYVFQMAKDMGFPFVKTRFPVKVDHRASVGGSVNCPNGNCRNAEAPGTGSGGSDGFRFALAEANTNFGMANCFDVVIHEFGHALLWESVGHPNLGFAHNCGDALAAIMCDPDSKSRDKGKTFWCAINRRHDRKVTEGWAWGGTNDTGFPTNGGYRSEEILSTTMFRIYKAIGGDSNSKDLRKKASRYMTYLILKTLATIDPNTRARDAREFLSVLTNSELTTNEFEGFYGGKISKVIRWAFEKQGLFQPPGSPLPVNREGAPPEIDVYIDDGRKGEYQYESQQLGEAKDICSRYISDDVFQHQDPVANRENFLYVKVKNRGSSAATNIIVKAYSSKKSTPTVFPTDWTPLDTQQIAANDELPSGGELIVGPFNWTPTLEDKSILVNVSARGDHSNADILRGSIPTEYLVLFDNNNAQRSVRVVQNEP
jgi:hypothetical protein